MAVLIEAASVIVRMEAIQNKYFGGISAFYASIPNDTYCSDGLLCRVGFMSDADAHFYISELMNNGLHRPLKNEKNTDIAYAQQDIGLVQPCSWLTTGPFVIDHENHTVLACSLNNDPQQGLAVPPHWSYEQYASLQRHSVDEIESISPKENASILEVRVNNSKEKLYIGTTSKRNSSDTIQ